jgi:HSP20 family molecular chaperone IbpA
LKIASVTPEKREQIIRETIARRAFQLSEARKFEPGHSHEDWKHAESEIMGPLSCGCLMLDRNYVLSADAASFGEGEIEIYVEPRRLTIRGRAQDPRASTGSIYAGHKAHAYSIIRVIDLPVEIEPSEATATFRGRMIQMNLPKACEKRAASVTV